MNHFAPAYYPAFHCIAGDCTHSCCIGWQICIDPATLARYRALPPKARKAILSHTVTDREGTSFRLTCEGRCPFLTEEGLCSLIQTHGEGILCEICREHPRFYNTFSDRTEAGIGLCCEEAARLILTEQAPFSLICIEESDEFTVPDPFEAIFFAEREENFRILFDRTQPLRKRIETLASRYSLPIDRIFRSDRRWQEIYRSLERLDPAWEGRLSAWETVRADDSLISMAEGAAEQLIAYFLYRHLADAMEKGDYTERVAFALLSAHVIGEIARAAVPDHLPTLIDVARAYSAEIEYDDGNVDAILKELRSMG